MCSTSFVFGSYPSFFEMASQRASLCFCQSVCLRSPKNEAAFVRGTRHPCLMCNGRDWTPKSCYKLGTGLFETLKISVQGAYRPSISCDFPEIPLSTPASLLLHKIPLVMFEAPEFLRNCGFRETATCQSKVMDQRVYWNATPPGCTGRPRILEASPHWSTSPRPIWAWGCRLLGPKSPDTKPGALSSQVG